MRRAELRRSALVMISSSIRWSLEGKLVDWMTNTSSPRTFSRISTKISLSANRRMLAFTSGRANLAEMASASGLLLLPVRIFMAKPLISKEKTATPGRDGAEHTNESRDCKRLEIQAFRQPRRLRQAACGLATNGHCVLSALV